MIPEKVVLQRIKDANINMSMIEKYNGGVRNNHLFRCNECGKTFRKRLDHVFNGAGCKFCNGGGFVYSISDVNNIVKKFNFKLDGEYKRSYIKTSWKCLKCGCVFESKLNNIVNNQKHCPQCSHKYYKNEAITGEVLRKLFPTIKITKNLRIDAPDLPTQKCVLVDYSFKLNNKIYFVEYHGHQHYKPVKFWEKTYKEAKTKLQKQRTRDSWLRLYCKNNKITLIEINGMHYYGLKIKCYLEKCFNRPMGK